MKKLHEMTTTEVNVQRKAAMSLAERIANAKVRFGATDAEQWVNSVAAAKAKLQAELDE